MARSIPSNIRVGTASWTDPSLIKSKKFYPRGCNSAEERLRYYAELGTLGGTHAR